MFKCSNFELLLLICFGKKDPLMNINTGSIALTGAVLLGGLVTTYLWKSVIKDQAQFANGPNYYPTYGRRSTTKSFIPSKFLF